MITDEDIAAFLSQEPSSGRYELIVRAGYRYEHPFRRVVLGVMPLVPVADNAQISVYAGGALVMQAPVIFGAVPLSFAAPLLLSAGEEIYVVVASVEPPHRSYTGAAVALTCG